MDIRSWGQSFLSRIKSLPGKAGDLPAKAQEILGDLPGSVQDGAKAVLANEQVAEGWRTVAKGAGELTGWHQDHTNISPGATPGATPEPVPAAGKITTNPAVEVPANVPTGKPGAHGTVTPEPHLEPGKTPRVRRPGKVTPAQPTPGGAHPTPVQPAPGGAHPTPVQPVPAKPPAVRPTPGKPSPASQVLKPGAKVPVKVSGFDAKKPYASVARHATERATLLEATGNPAQAQEMRDFATRMRRAQELYKQGNTPAASRMFHAKIKIGLRNPELQEAVRMGNKADEVVAAFGQAPTSAKGFTAASEKMLARATQLREMGHPAEARQLSTFAGKLTKAGEQYAAGNKDAAFNLFRKGFNGKTQGALKVSAKADEVFAAFGKGGKTGSTAAQAGKAGATVAKAAKPVAKPFATAAARMTARAEQLAGMGHAQEAKQLSTFAGKLTKAGEAYAKGNKDAAFQLFRKGFDGKAQGALKVSNQADEVFAAFGKAPKGAKAAATAARSTKQAATIAETAQAATKTVKQAATVAETATKTVRASRGAATATRTATTATRVAGGAKAAKGAKVAVQAIESGARTIESGGGAVKAATQVAEQGGKAVKTASTAAQASKGAQAATTATRTATTATRVARGAKAAKGAQVAVQAAETGAQATKGVAQVAKAGKGAAQAVEGAVQAAEGAKAASGAAKGFMGSAKNFLSGIGDKVKGLFGKITKGAGSSKGWQTMKEGVTKMLPGIGKAMKSGAIFSAVFSLAENLIKVFKGERTLSRAIGGIFGDTVSGTLGSAVSALASGAAIAALGALGVVGWPLTLAAGAVGVIAFMGFDRIFRDTSIYDWLTHMFT